MSRYLYSEIKDDPVPTFKCEGCGLRFPSKKLYPRGNSIDLKNGIYHTQAGMIIKMVCSRTCLYKAPVKTLKEFLEWNGIKQDVVVVNLAHYVKENKKKVA